MISQLLLLMTRLQVKRLKHPRERNQMNSRWL
jgi:hypothetical protein